MFQFSDFMIFELTLECNLKCSYCYLDYEHFNAKSKTMTLEIFKKVVDKIAYQRLISSRERQLIIVLHGGEPTLLGANTLESMIDYFKRVFDTHGLKYYLTIQTNGIAIDESFLPAFKKINNVGISFDGVDSSITLRHNSQNKVKKTIDMLESNGINYGIVSVISKQNFSQTDKIFNNTKSFVKFVPVYDTNNIVSEIEMSSKEYFDEVILRDLKNKFYINSNTTSITLERVFMRALIDIMFEHSDSTQSTCSFKFCGSGTKIVAIEPDGSIHNCDRWSLNKGNDKEYFVSTLDNYDFLSLSQLVRAINFASIAHNIQKREGCDTCYARYACQWDCQAMHYSKYGEYGLDKNKICYEAKSMYRYIENNLKEIISDFADNKKDIIFKEDTTLGMKRRVEEILKRLNIKYKILIEHIDDQRTERIKVWREDEKL